MPDLIKCPTCGDNFNPAYLDQVSEHMHEGIIIDQTIKGVKIMDIEEIKKQKELLEINLLTAIVDYQKLTGIVIDNLSIDTFKGKFNDPDIEPILRQKVNIKITL